MSEATEKAKPAWCAACHGSGVRFVRGPEATYGRVVLPCVPWEGADGRLKRAVRCRCVGGEPYHQDPDLPGHPRCVCKGRGWMAYRTEAEVPEGREILGGLLGAGVMAECPCRRSGHPDHTGRPRIAREPDQKPPPPSSFVDWTSGGDLHPD